MEGFSWFCPPKSSKFLQNGVEMTTHNKTDFWQRTHYGFQNDNGHFLYKKVKGDFTLTAKTSYNSNTLYDQCGVMVRFDSDNWVKSSCEYENEKISHLGAVVTNRGYSDWSTQEIPRSCGEIYYKMDKTKDCFVIHASIDQGKTYMQLRVCHFDKHEEELMVGVYACSPQREGFECKIYDIEIKPK